jgi:hypothetical protein
MNRLRFCPTKRLWPNVLHFLRTIVPTSFLVKKWIPVSATGELRISSPFQIYPFPGLLFAICHLFFNQILRINSNSLWPSALLHKSPPLWVLLQMLSFLISISLSANPLVYDPTSERVFGGIIAVIVRNCRFSVLSSWEIGEVNSPVIIVSPQGKTEPLQPGAQQLPSEVSMTSSSRLANLTAPPSGSPRKPAK